MLLSQKIELIACILACPIGSYYWPVLVDICNISIAVRNSMKKKTGKKTRQKGDRQIHFIKLLQSRKTNTNSSYVHNYHTFSETSVTLLGLYFLSTEFLKYSKPCVKRPLSKRPKIGIQDQLSLDAGQKYCRMLQGEHSAILSTFVKLPFAIKIFILSIFEWPFYTSFTGRAVAQW